MRKTNIALTFAAAAGVAVFLALPDSLTLRPALEPVFKYFDDVHNKNPFEAFVPPAKKAPAPLSAQANAPKAAAKSEPFLPKITLQDLSGPAPKAKIEPVPAPVQQVKEEIPAAAVQNVPVQSAPSSAVRTPQPALTEDNAAQLASERLAQDDVFTLSDTLQVAARFGYGDSVLSPVFLKAVDGIADYMKAHPERCPVLSVVGHADRQPGDNLGLSWDRAGTLANALNDRGIPYARVREHGMGAREPLVPNAHTPEQYAQNRRVEVRCTPKRP
jgi:outer membrane protein OmpA-like peptidoglycan-associated protein